MTHSYTAPAMESFANIDMEDYWNEYRTVSGRRAELHGSHSEEDSRSHDDDVDSDDTFLEVIIPDGLKKDREITETELINSRLYSTLTPRQKEQLIRRTQERNRTLRQKRLKAKGQKPDLWSVFSGNDNSSTGTRSRSATPDSLDSLSPPHTPPDPSPKHWVDPHLSRSIASLDSGHHSLITSGSPFSPVSPASASSHNVDSQLATTPDNYNLDRVKINSGQHHTHPEVALNDKYYYPSEDQSCYRYKDPLLDNFPKSQFSSDFSRPNKEVKVKRQRSFATDLNKDVTHYYSHKGLYEFSPKFYYDPNVPGVQGLHYKQIGSLHKANYRQKEMSVSCDDSFIYKDHEHKSPKGVIRSHSIKHTPRDPFDHVGDKDYGLHYGDQDNLVKYEGDINLNFENMLRSSSSTDLGFKVLRNDKDEDFPDLLLEVGRSGQTKVDWLSNDDLSKLSSLSLLELDILFSENNIHHNWRKRNKKRKHKEGESGVFGVSIETLIEKDNNLLLDPFIESHVPQILQKLINQLELRGLRDEGILRIPGHRAKTEELRRVLDEFFYGFPERADEALRNASPNEIAALIKLFLRELPQPLLTYTHAPAFYKAHKILDIGERVLALTMLIFLLPPAYRDTLKVILDLCNRVVANERDNKMGLYNVAMIIAPNIFLPSLQPKSKLNVRGDDKGQQLSTEMEYARVTTQLVQALIKYQEVLWTVPNRLIAQVRRQCESSLRPSNTKPIHRIISKRNKNLIQRPIVNEVEYQNGVMRISAPQFNKISHPIKLDWKMTAREILIRFIEEQAKNASEAPSRVVGRREQQQTKKLFDTSTSSILSSASKASNPVSITTCLLRRSLRHALDNHALHEMGGNIGERRIDHNAHLIAVYQDNPNGTFLVRCHHPGGQID